MGEAIKPSQRLALLSSFLHFSLSAADTERIREELRRTGPWADLAEQAMRRLVAPLLYSRGLQRGFLQSAPADFVEFLELTHRLNRVRNQRLREQAAAFSEALENHGLRVVALKGAAISFGDAERPEGGPLMSDIDLLVSARDRDRAVAIAASLGYAASNSALDGHSTVLSHPDCSASIDLHHDVGPQRDLLHTEDALDRAERLPGAALWQLRPSDQAIHNIYHSQIQNRFYELAIPSLHQLCNFGLLLERYAGRVDWDLIRHRLDQAGYRSHLSAYLYLADRLLGTRSSPKIAFGLRERLHFRRMMLQLDWPWLHDVVTYPAILTAQATQTRIGYRRVKGLPVQRPAVAIAMTVLRGLRRHRGASLSKFMDVHRRRFGRR